MITSAGSGSKVLTLGFKGADGQYWKLTGRTDSCTLTDKGFKSIFVPYQSLYLDMMQVSEPEADVNEVYQGGWGPSYVNSVPTVYNVNPLVSLSGRENMLLGVQGNMWTETTNDYSLQLKGLVTKWTFEKQNVTTGIAAVAIMDGQLKKGVHEYNLLGIPVTRAYRGIVVRSDGKKISR
jgi:hypothetical protein